MDIRGAMYPWGKLLRSGNEEETPVLGIKRSHLNTILLRIVAIAAWNYYCVTQDKKLASRKKGFLLSKNVQTSGHRGLKRKRAWPL